MFKSMCLCKHLQKNVSVFVCVFVYTCIVHKCPKGSWKCWEGRESQLRQNRNRRQAESSPQVFQRLNVSNHPLRLRLQVLVTWCMPKGCSNSRGPAPERDWEGREEQKFVSVVHFREDLAAIDKRNQANEWNSAYFGTIPKFYTTERSIPQEKREHWYAKRDRETSMPKETEGLK